MLNKLKSFKILPELQLKNLDQPLCSKSEQKFRTTRQLPNLQQTVANIILIIDISNSNIINKFWVSIFTCLWLPLPAVEKLHSYFSDLEKLFTARRNCYEINRQLASFTAIKSTKRHGHGVSECEWVSDKHSQWSDSGPIKTTQPSLQRLIEKLYSISTCD